MGLIIRIAIIFAIIFFFTKVNLSPQISSDYFFSSSDPAYQGYQIISNIFPPKESLILIVKSKTYSIQSNQYYRQIAKLTNKILALKGVVSVFSLSHGPENPTEANENLVWKEIIFGESNSATSSTLITSAINRTVNPNFIKDFEKLIEENKSDSFTVQLSGTPYIVEMIKRYIYKDVKVFVLATLVISAIVLLILFRSWLILIGTFITTISATLLSLILMQFFKIPLGILSPNLAMIILLITQSHIIFLTSNYFNIGKLNTAIKRTFPASLWSMVAMFCGFWSLSMVQAKSLSEFGFGGIIGTIIAISFAYLIYPVTLNFVLPKAKQNKEEITMSIPPNLEQLFYPCFNNLLLT